MQLWLLKLLQQPQAAECINRKSPDEKSGLFS
jgi:hypothetical protein